MAETFNRAELLEYIRATFVPPDRALESIRARSAEAGLPQIHVAPDEGYLLAFLLKSIGARHGKTPGEVAIAWVLRHPAVTGAIVGARRPGQLRGLVGAADWRLTAAEVEEVAAFLRANPA